MSIHVAMVEDSRSFRRSVRLVMKNTPGLCLDAEAGSVEQLTRVLDEPRSMAGRWDVVLMDLDLPGASGIEGIRRVKAKFPNVAVLVCTVFEDPATIVEAIAAGADGYVLKSVRFDELVDQIRVVSAGGASLSAPVARTLVDVVRRQHDATSPASPTRLDLTDRERDVLRCLVDGLTYKESATRLGVSPHTVRTHIRALYKKLQVSNVAEAVNRAIRERLT